MAERLESRAVLGGAYKTRPARMLSHAVLVDEQGIAVRVLCTRVDLDSLADRYASDPTVPPSCPACRRAWRMHQP